MTTITGEPVTPRNIEAEKHLLAAVMVRPEALVEVVDVVTPDDFHLPEHGRILRAMIRLGEAGRAIDPVTLRDALCDGGDDLEAVGGLAYLNLITDGVARSANVSHYAEIVVDRARERRALQALKLATSAVEAHNLDQARAAVEQLGDSLTGGRRARGAAFDDAATVMVAPRPAEIVEGIAWAGCITVLASESGTGKTFVLLDLATAVSEGRAWHGRDVQPGSVAYLSYEGDALGSRLRAIRDVQGRPLDHVYVLRAAHEPLSPRITRDGTEARSLGELSATAALDALTARLTAEDRPPIRAVVVDTVRASLTGSEDSSEHVSAYLRAVRRLAGAVPDAAIILAHHTGWQDGEQARKRERGSSAWRGNCDATVYFEAGDYDRERGEARLTLRTLKTRDAERPAPLYLIRRRVELAEQAGDDLRRGAITSCVIERDGRTREDREAEQSAALAAEAAALDRRVLLTIRDRPELATSQDRLRATLGVRRDLVIASVARLIERDAITPPERQRQPYTLTDAGRTELGSEATL